MRFIFLVITLSLVCCKGYAQEIAITFDDAPTGDGPLFDGETRTNKILQQLKKHGIDEVAFFVLTSNISAANLGRLSRYSNAGHVLANHSHTHQHIHRIGALAYIRDVQHADSMLQSYKSYMPWFRFPFLDEGRTTQARDSIREALKTLKLINGYVTVDNYDWYLNHLLKQANNHGKRINMSRLRDIYIEHIVGSIEFYDAVARKHLGRSPRHVLLLHENDLSALFLGDLINHLKQKGWKIISPRLAYEDPISEHIPNVLFNGQGRVAAIAREKGVPARELVQESEDEAFLDALVERRNVFE